MVIGSSGSQQPSGMGVGRATLHGQGIMDEQCCSQEAFLQELMVTVGTAASAGYYWSDGRWLDCRRAAAVDEHSDSSGLGRAADMDFDGRRKLGASTSLIKHIWGKRNMCPVRIVYPTISGARGSSSGAMGLI